MQDKEKHSDRRHDQRRHEPVIEISLHDQSRSDEDRRLDQRRDNERVDCSFEASLSGQNAETVDVSSRSVCLDVITNDIESFSPGTKMSLQILTVDSYEKPLKLSGSGTIIRNEIKSVTNRGTELYVVVEFLDKLDVSME